jgi:carbamoyltransferase
MYILGLNAYHPDSAAALVRDGQLVAAVEEERFKRIKHWSGFPREAISYCLEEAGIDLEDVDYITLNRNPRANLHKKLLFALQRRPKLDLILNRLSNLRKISNIRTVFAEEFGISDSKIRAQFVNVEHHLAHVASSFLVSGFEDAALVSIDGLGDFSSVMVARGRGNKVEPLYRVNYPHSLGIFYTAFTQLLGFMNYGDEYKIMGLAGFGEPQYIDKMRDVVRLLDGGRFKLNLKYFEHHLLANQMQWHNTAPSFGRLYSDRLCEQFGEPGAQDSEPGVRDKNIAASVQAIYEEGLFHILNHAYDLTKCPQLCLAGGCALNSLANGKIFDRTPFTDIYIPPGAHDAGGSIGSAFYLYNHILDRPRSFSMDTAYWGPECSDKCIQEVIDRSDVGGNGFSIRRADSMESVIAETSRHLADGKIVGWFQGRMEWGPRALGNRSILADPRREDMRDIINSKIKMREMFRPFAPSILEEYTGQYFQKDYPDPFMLKVYPVREEKREIIPAVTHVDGTGRLQTVSKSNNPLYWKLIKNFHELTGVPILLNTSFNENEPVVCSPQEAMDCFLRTSMDILVMGNTMIERT